MIPAWRAVCLSALCALVSAFSVLCLFVSPQGARPLLPFVVGATGDDVTEPSLIEEVETAQKERFGCIVFENDGTALTDTLDTSTIWMNLSADSTYLLTDVVCETDTGTFTMDLLRDDGSPADVVSNCACDSNQEICTVLTAEDDFAIDEEMNLNVDSVASSPTRVSICMGFQIQ